MKSNINEFEMLLEHYKNIYQFVITWMVLSFGITYLESSDPYEKFNVATSVIMILLFVWFNYRKVLKIKATCEKYEIPIENVADDTDKV